MRLGEHLLMRTLSDAYHEKRASHLRSIMDISDGGDCLVDVMLLIKTVSNNPSQSYA